MSNSRKILTGVGCLLAFMLVVVIIVHFATNDLVKVINQQLAAVRSGDIEKAYSYTSVDFKNATSLTEFNNFVEQYPALKENKKLRIIEREVANGEARIKAVLYSSKGVVTPIEYLLVQEDGSWRILGISVKPAGAYNEADDEQAPSATADANAMTNTYDNQESRYTMKYPASWEYEKSGDGTVIFSGRRGTPDYFSTVNIQTVLTKKSGGDFSTIKQFMSDIKHQAVSESPGVKFLESGTVDIAERDGSKDHGEFTVFTYKYKGKEFKQWQVVVLRADGQVFYAWAYTSPIEQYPKNQAVAKAMLESWTIY